MTLAPYSRWAQPRRVNAMIVDDYQPTRHSCQAHCSVKISGSNPRIESALSEVTRTRYSNALRGTVREYGLSIPLGTTIAKSRVAIILGDQNDGLPPALRSPLSLMVAEVHGCDDRIAQLERDLRLLANGDRVVKQLLSLPGVGPLTAKIKEGILAATAA